MQYVDIDIVVLSMGVREKFFSVRLDIMMMKQYAQN